MAEKKP
jgi:2-methylcitrate synthase